MDDTEVFDFFGYDDTESYCSTDASDEFLSINLRTTTTPLKERSPAGWTHAADSGWKNDVALVMNAFRSCRTDDLTSLVPSVSFNSLEGKLRSTEVQQLQEIEAWRNDLGFEASRPSSYDVGYEVTSRFRFP